MGLRRLDHLLVLTDDLEATNAVLLRRARLRAGERPPLGFPGYWLYLDGEPCVHIAERASYEAHAAALGLPRRPGAGRPRRLRRRTATTSSPRASPTRASRRSTNDVPAAGLRQLFFTDPNGVRIELNVR